MPNFDFEKKRAGKDALNLLGWFKILKIEIHPTRILLKPEIYSTRILPEPEYTQPVFNRPSQLTGLMDTI